MRTLTLLAVVLCLSFIAAGQDALPPQHPAQSGVPASEQPTITLPGDPEVRVPARPKWLMYRFWFQDVELFDKAAVANEAHGEDGTGWRNFAQFKTGISSDEAVTLKQVAYECNRAIEENEKKVQVVLKGVRARLAQGIRPSGEELKDVDHEQQIVEEHIKQLRERLSEVSFKNLDSYVFHRFGDQPKILVPRRSSPSDLSTPPTPIPPPTESPSGQGGGEC